MSAEPSGGPPLDGAPHAGPDGYRLRYQQAFEFALDARLVTDDRGVILEANQAAAALARCRKEFLVGKPLGLFVSAEHRNLFYRNLVELGVPYAQAAEFETSLGRDEGRRDVAIRASRVEAGPGHGVILDWVLRDITERRLADAVRADLLRRLVTAQEDERRRVARELHDSVGQLLSALGLAVRAARDGEPLTPATLARLDAVQRITDELSRTSHDLAVRLRPTALDDIGLPAALQAFTAEWSQRAGVEVHLQCVGLDRERLDPEVETTLYRVVQEALTNVTKHARARLASIVVERRDGEVMAMIEDDGIGFDPQRLGASGRLGLLGMLERSTLVGGTFQVEASPGTGTLLRVVIPNGGRRG